MEANTTTNAFVRSIALHGAIVGLFFFLTWYSTHFTPPPPKIFELVAGPGDDIMATQAAKGSEQGTLPAVKMPSVPQAKIPEPVAEPAPLPEPTTPPAADPVAKPVAEPVAKPATPPPVTKSTAVPDLTKTVKRAETRAAKAEEKKIATQKAAEDRVAKEAALKDKRLSYDEFVREQAAKNGGKAPAPTATRSGKAPRIDSDGLVRGLSNGTGQGAGGKALTAAQQTLFDAYASRLRQALRDAHRMPPGLSDLLQCRVQFAISANGGLSNIRIVKSSGNSEFDQSAIAAFAAVGSIGPTPDGKGDTWVLDFSVREET
ncbi:MAG TPA: cell envelope integrity protein TolA [Opitutaceae bacterium]|nr:cell envelope integrity protein TolA [Opitutaceae bacterium]